MSSEKKTNKSFGPSKKQGSRANGRWVKKRKRKNATRDKNDVGFLIFFTHDGDDVGGDARARRGDGARAALKGRARREFPIGWRMFVVFEIC